MSPVAVSLITLAFVFGGALLGMCLRITLPKDHLGGDSRDVVKLGMGLVGTMAALVLGLLIASAKSSFDTQGAELTGHVEQDRLAGPRSGPRRPGIEGNARSAAHLGCPRHRSDGRASQIRPFSIGPVIFQLRSSRPQNTGTLGAERRRTFEPDPALNIVIALGQTRWLMYEQRATSISIPLLAVLIFWLTIVFISASASSPRLTRP